MKQLSPSARRLFELARGQDEPDASARNRVAHALAAKIATGASPGAVGASAYASAAGWGSIAVKSALVVSVTGALAAGGWLALRSPRPVAPSGTVPQTASRIAQPTAKVHIDEARSPESPESDAVEDQGGAPIHRKPGRLSLRMEAPPSTPPPVPATPDRLRAETEALRLAQQALRDGTPRQTLRLLDEQDERFPDGLLQQERAAARVLALCQAGLVREARAQASRFERLWPRSALLGRVRAACSPRVPIIDP
jgi:hypothetical protein